MTLEIGTSRSEVGPASVQSTGHSPQSNKLRFRSNERVPIRNAIAAQSIWPSHSRQKTPAQRVWPRWCGVCTCV